MFNQGTVVGPFSLLLTLGTLLPRVLPAFCRFAHGRIQIREHLKQLIETAAMVMARRGQKWTGVHAEYVFTLFDRTEVARRKLIQESEQRWLRRVV